MDFEKLQKAIEDETTKIEAELEAEMADHTEWYKLITQIGKVVGCLPSAFPKGNEHIVEKIQELVDYKNTHIDDGR